MDDNPYRPPEAEGPIPLKAASERVRTAITGAILCGIIFGFGTYRHHDLVDALLSEAFGAVLCGLGGPWAKSEKS